MFCVTGEQIPSHTVYMKLSGAAINGFTTVILLLLIIGSSLMIGLGIIGEYLARIYDEVKQRPRYIVSQKLPLNQPDNPASP